MGSTIIHPEEIIFASYYDLMILAFAENDKIKRIKHKGKYVASFAFKRDNVPDDQKIEEMRFSIFIERARRFGIEYYAYYLEMDSYFSRDAYNAFTKRELDCFLDEHSERKTTQYGVFQAGYMTH